MGSIDCNLPCHALPPLSRPSISDKSLFAYDRLGSTSSSQAHIWCYDCLEFHCHCSSLLSEACFMLEMLGTWKYHKTGPEKQCISLNKRDRKAVLSGGT